MGKILKIKKFLLTLYQETILTTVNQNRKAMDAPIDIIINIIRGHQEQAKIAGDSYPDNSTPHLVWKAKEEAYAGLVAEFEGFKRLFN